MNQDAQLAIRLVQPANLRSVPIRKPMGMLSLPGAPATACSERSVAEAIDRRERRLLRARSP